jgi:hypothetical protein
MRLCRLTRLEPGQRMGSALSPGNSTDRKTNCFTEYQRAQLTNPNSPHARNPLDGFIHFQTGRSGLLYRISLYPPLSRGRRQSENLPRVVRRCDVVAQHLDDPCRFLDQRRIARRHLAFLQIDVVLEPDARVAAEQHGLRHHGELMQRRFRNGPRWRVKPG